MLPADTDLAPRRARLAFGLDLARNLNCARFHFHRRVWARRRVLGEARLTPRQVLAYGLVRCRVLVGRRAEAVRRLLGRPALSLETRWQWVVGPARTVDQAGSELLVVHLRAGRVRSAELMSP